MAPQSNFEGLVQDERVHRKIYMDADVFEAEMERIFERTWVFVGHESEIAAAGDYKTVSIGTQPAIMTRDEDGRVHVLMNRCMHRGSTICQEQRGNSSYLRCWYHGWTYTNRGGLVGVPYAAGYGKSFDRSRFSLVRAKVGIYRGLVFASLNFDVPEI